MSTVERMHPPETKLDIVGPSLECGSSRKSFLEWRSSLNTRNMKKTYNYPSFVNKYDIVRRKVNFHGKTLSERGQGA